MAEGDVETVDKQGQWVNRVIGSNELSTSYSSKEEAIQAGRSLAEELGSRHIVVEAESTGAITDPGE